MTIKCDRCGKDEFFTPNNWGKKKPTYLCKECATEWTRIYLNCMLNNFSNKQITHIFDSKFMNVKDKKVKVTLI